MTIQEWLNSDNIDNKSRKGYAHFDCRTGIKEQKDYISNPENIARHGFYPFIHYEKKQIKYSKKGGKKEKSGIFAMRRISTVVSINTTAFFWGNYIISE